MDKEKEREQEFEMTLRYMYTLTGILKALKNPTAFGRGLVARGDDRTLTSSPLTSPSKFGTDS